MKDSGENITLTFTIHSDGTWMSNRGNVPPGDYPRAIQALKDVVANMADDYGGWAVQIALTEGIEQNWKRYKERVAREEEIIKCAGCPQEILRKDAIYRGKYYFCSDKCADYEEEFGPLD